MFFVTGGQHALNIFVLQVVELCSVTSQNIEDLLHVYTLLRSSIKMMMTMITVKEYLRFMGAHVTRV